MIASVFRETVRYRRLRRTRGGNGEVASRAFVQMKRFGSGGFLNLAKPASAPVRTPRSVSQSLIPLQFGSRVFS
jgi:hypothetical protein